MLAADAGAADIVDLGETWQVTTPPTELHAVRTTIEEAGIPVKESDLTMVRTDLGRARRGVGGQIGAADWSDALEDHDDVEAVYANFDIPESVLEAVTA